MVCLNTIGGRRGSALGGVARKLGGNPCGVGMNRGDADGGGHGVARLPRHAGGSDGRNARSSGVAP